MSPVVTDEVDALLDIEALERAWHGTATGTGPSITKANQAHLTITRNAQHDFQDRQVYLFVDAEPWGKVRYGHAVSGDIAPGRHLVRAFNTLFSHTIEVQAVAGEHVRLRCTNAMPRAGWLMMIFLHVTALRVRLERE
jgi:hypothetical protein